jgi:hypothetical protein
MIVRRVGRSEVPECFGYDLGGLLAALEKGERRLADHLLGVEPRLEVLQEPLEQVDEVLRLADVGRNHLLDDIVRQHCKGNE